MGKCKDCRFFTGTTCDLTGYKCSSLSTCFNYASNIKSDSKKCRDCRFYQRRICNITGYKSSSMSTCFKFSPYR